MTKKRKTTASDVEAKRRIIQAYFDERKRQLDRANKLIRQNDYLFEGVLVLCCHIASYAALRFPWLKDGEAYKRIVLKYSGKRPFYQKIDLLFLYQWWRSDFRSHGAYKTFKNYSDVKKTLVSKFGDENGIQHGKRYLAQSSIIKRVNSNPFLGLDKKNLKRSLPLFSVSEQLYRYLRSFAVHNFRFPFLSRVGDRYVANHIITPEVLLETARNILTNLEKECLEKAKFPEQLRQNHK